MNSNLEKLMRLLLALETIHLYELTWTRKEGVMIPMAAQDILQEESPGVDKGGGRGEEGKGKENMLVCANLKLN